ncbi:MAG: MBL fold metallo-hydrolase [Firmicutes bacterium]|nr:MBL fold metallo-hydrolase [Bacillota bacterium]
MRITPLPVPTPFPIGPVNAYLLPGPPVTLIDCGPKTPEALAALDRGLVGAGTRLEAIQRLILTHGHLDHFGLAATVAAASGARIYAHPAEVPKLTADRAFVEPARAFIREAGFGADVADRWLEVMRSYRQHLDRVTPTDLVDDGDRLPLAEGALEVLHTPGHAQGHICLWDGQTLIAGDLLMGEISPNPVVEFDANGQRLRTLPAYLQSLRRVASLRPAVAYPGHGDPLQTPAARALELIRHHEARKEALAALLAGRRWTVRELIATWFPALDPRQLYLAISEVTGHLDLLEAEGRLIVERRDGVCYYAHATAT